MFLGLLRRDLLLVYRRRADAVTVLVFFSIVVSLFPLGVGADPNLLRLLGGGVVWVAALLASLLSLNRLFAADHADGTLEQILLSPLPLPLTALAKVTAHWIATGIPLTLMAPVLGMQFGLDGDGLLVLSAGVLLGTPVLSLVGAVGAALTLGLRGGNLLVALLILPLNIPVLILGAGAVDAAQSGLGAGAHLSLLGALLVGTLVGAPFAVAAALRISLD
ncbi:MAG: heme exporter protein CcmB [Pseudomonadota bacterium]|nr:heme exporter protein CcmB [Pseudomonadota bacterium]